MPSQEPLALEIRQMVLHRPLAELQPLGETTGREGGLGGEIPEDPRIDGGAGRGADL